MAVTPEGMGILTAEVVSMKGECGAGHKVGDTLTLSCWDTGGLCGFFYHDIFPSLNVMQFGGAYPWGEAEVMKLECPDREVAVTIKVRKSK
ncbi:MAG: TIGR04076 family protein [Pseudomonadota bacterium]